MNPDDDGLDEAPFSSLFDAADQAAPPPDAAFLARLREQSAAEFVRAHAASGTAQSQSLPVDSPPGVPSTNPLAAPPLETRRTMFPLALRAVVAASAAVIVIGSFVTNWRPHTDEPPAFGDVLAQTANAETLHLRLIRHELPEEIWAAKPRLLRWEASDGTYRIARQDSLWVIDERENRVDTQRNHLFVPAYGCEAAQAGETILNLLALLNEESAEKEQFSQVEGERPVETVQRDGVSFYRYRMELAPAHANEPLLELTALVDVSTHLLRSLEADAIRNGRAERVAELNVLAVNQPVDETKFVVRDTLTEDGRIGKVTDVQGTAAVKPVMQQRWTPVATKLPLKPGDWVRTDTRGANAIALRLMKRKSVILGPGSLVELLSPTQLRLHSGTVEIDVPEGETLELLGAGAEKIAVTGTQIYRRRDDKLAKLEKAPVWLQGFKGTIVQESLGSLLARDSKDVDARNVPLSVGYHKVSVDIRDQIARTVIEESFVNHLDHELEGVFYFPLPQDASISGFGMWIGNELVEADVVEKQRAREIYETILREKRDPGLLEWTGGNIFKARVYPIPAHSEKRIKLSYTQVLPLRGNKYRYSYALQSEMLKLHPLRELSLDIKVHSATALKQVSSPTHDVRADQTAHSAHLEFAAQEYTPTRDFEVLVETDSSKSELVLIPHRRGDDGYFLLQLTPSFTGPWQREVIPDCEPLELLIVADSSASMDAGQRKIQGVLVAALLGSLTPRDKFNLACADVEADWVFPRPLAAEPKSIAQARDFLAQRISLGWTDLDRAFQSVFQQLSVFQQQGPRANTHVVYLGDGIITTGDAKPEAFAQRVKQAYPGQGICHAVALGSSFESPVLKAIASLGGGSVRHVSGEQGPQAVALELLSEIARPGLKDLQVEFRGLRTARVYPAELPNLPQGGQQILLGLYQPEKGVQSAEVIVTGKQLVVGKQEAQSVTFRTQVSLPDAPEENSFIPRIWARLQLDALLEQGQSAAVKDEIIALSEEFQIMTPYTSFLVLETDADRARFKVQRRFRMRDGEKYFQQGRDTANFELVQQQMRRAGQWRLGLRRQALTLLGQLGRQISPAQSKTMRRSAGEGGSGRGGFGGYDLFGSTPWGPMSGSESGPRGGVDWYFAQAGRMPAGFAGRGLELGGSEDADIEVENFSRTEVAQQPGEPFELYARLGDLGRKEPAQDAEIAVEERLHASLSDEIAMPPADQPMFESNKRDFTDFSDMDMDFKSTVGLRFGGNRRQAVVDGLSLLPYRLATDNTTHLENYRQLGRQPYGWLGQTSPGQYTQWVETLFPQLSVAATRQKPRKASPLWNDEALALSRSLLRVDALTRIPGGLEIVQTTDSFHVRGNELASRSQQRQLVSQTAWLKRFAADNAQTLFNWCNETERGVFGLAFQLGTIRKSVPSDLGFTVLELSDYSIAPLHETFAGYTPTLEPQGDQRTLLILKPRQSPTVELRLLIDTERHVLLLLEHRQNGNTSSSTKFDDFLKVGGGLWASTMETLDEQGRRSALVSQTVTELAPEAFTARIQTELAPRGEVQFLQQPGLTVPEAKRAQARLGELTFDVPFTLLLHFARSQQWTRVLEQLDRCEKLAQGKPGMAWVRDAVLEISRRHEELKQRLLERATAIATLTPRNAEATPAGDELFLANFLLNQAGNLLQANEMLALLENVKPIMVRQAARLGSLKSWKERRISSLQNAGQRDQLLREQRLLAAENPRDANTQQQYARMLFEMGDDAAAYAWLTQTLAAAEPWDAAEELALRDLHADFLRRQGRLPELVEFLEQTAKRNFDNYSPYQQYLSALLQADQVPRAEELTALWLREAQVQAALPPAVAARLLAAVYVATGSGYNLNSDRVESRWHQPLGELVLFFARERESLSPLDHLRHSRFNSTDEMNRVRKELAEFAAEQIAKLPLERVRSLLPWLEGTEHPPATWKRIADGILTRWTQSEDPDVKDAWGALAANVLAYHRGTPEWLDFLRKQFREGPEQHRASYAGLLFNAVVAQPWSQELEIEAFSLLEKMSDAEEVADRVAAASGALQKFTETMLQARVTLSLAQIEKFDLLTRTEQQAKRKAMVCLAREGLAARLEQELQKRRDAKPAENFAMDFSTWLASERVYLLTLLGQDLPVVVADCQAGLARLAAKEPANSDEFRTEQQLGRLLRERYLTTLEYLATASGADPAWAKHLLKRIDEGILAEPDQIYWKLHKFRLLVALDRVQELQHVLTGWIQGEDPLSRWRLALGFLQAERGAVPEAIKLFEGVESFDELGPEAYQALAGWYLAANRRADYELATVRVFQTLDEWRMSQWLYQQLGPWQQNSGNLPSELDQQVLLMFSALFEKSSSPNNYVHQLQQFYQASHDFRLLAVLADGLVGHSAQQVYPVLQQLTSVLTNIRDEATADELVQHLGQVRARAQTDVDRRAVDLLELLVERRAAEIQNQPGPHVARALAALRRAFAEVRAAGESRLFADLLAGLGAISQQPLADEQLRELTLLHEREPPGTFDRLHTALRLAQGQGSYGRRDAAIDLLATALAEFQQANEGVLPTSANDALGNYIDYLNVQGHYARAEKVLLDQLQHPLHGEQRLWLTRKWYEVCQEALQAGGRVSLGEGAPLYQALARKIQQDIRETTNHDQRYQLILQCGSLYRLAGGKKFPTVATDVKEFAYGTVTEALKQQTNYYSAIVSSVAQLLHDLSEPREGLAFLIAQFETEPGWFRYANQDGGSQHAYLLGQWREEAMPLGDLEPRLLKIVLAELRRDLESRSPRNRDLYHDNHGRFWKEKAADFARTAEEAWAAQRGSEASVLYIADYLYYGLERMERAIEMLFIAHREKLLSAAGQSTLVNYLHEQQRFGESIALLEALVAEQHQNLQFRVWLMHAYFRTQRPAELRELLTSTDAYFHEVKLWNVGTIAALAASCLQNQLFEQSVAYYNELIPLYERTQPNRGIGDGTLSQYYGSLALAYSGLKQTEQAVEAACGAIVSWGPAHRNRAEALSQLRRVLADAPELERYSKHLDEETQTSGKDNPIIRKALGQVYLERQKFPQALAQLQKAAELSPNDQELQQLLLSCFDQLQDQAGAVRQLLQSVELSRRDIGMYRDLGRRYTKLEQPLLAERAYTSIVEILSAESESHVALAEIRQEQNRWQNAIEQWQRVAEIRALEPTGLLKLAAAQLHEKQWDAARETLKKLRTTAWPARFNTVDQETRDLEHKVSEGAGQ